MRRLKIGITKKITFLILAGVFLLAACVGQGSSSSPDGKEVLAPVPTQYAGLKNPLGADGAGSGGEVFQTNCKTCHGPQGHGDGPAGQALDPRPKNLAELQTKAGDDYLFWRIHEGKPGTSMVAWKGILTDEQIWQLVSFLRTLK